MKKFLETDHLEDKGGSGKITLRWILGNWAVRTGGGWNWFIITSNGGLW
jgi:hypothetical protein